MFTGAVVAAYLLGKRKAHRPDDKIGGTSEESQDPTVPSYELEEQRRIAEASSEREPAELMSSYH